MFKFIKDKISGIYNHLSNKLSGIFTSSQVDEKQLEDLYKTLIASDAGTKFSNHVIDLIRKSNKNGQELAEFLKNEFETILNNSSYDYDADIFLLVGINGTGKTTFAAKLANHLKNNGKKVLLVAADTFRAAATNQLDAWAKRIGVDILIGKENQDPASLAFQATQKFDQYDAIIIDTAGRLQTKSNLMKELEKIKRVAQNNVPNKKLTTLLSIDSLLGQNSLEQAKVFKEAAQINGIVLTKMDGTSKGGVIFAIAQDLSIPVAYISLGENLDDLAIFNPKEYVNEVIKI